MGSFFVDLGKVSEYVQEHVISEYNPDQLFEQIRNDYRQSVNSLLFELVDSSSMDVSVPVTADKIIDRDLPDNVIVFYNLHDQYRGTYVEMMYIQDKDLNWHCSEVTLVTNVPSEEVIPESVEIKYTVKGAPLQYVMLYLRDAYILHKKYMEVRKQEEADHGKTAE